MLRDILRNPVSWLLVCVPPALLHPHNETLAFGLSLLALIPLAALLSQATESVAARTGDTIGGLLNATLGNLTELMVALTALRAGQFMLVKASIAGAIVTNSLFMVGASFLLGGLRHHVQEYNQGAARLQAGLLFVATVALLVPSAVGKVDATGAFPARLSFALAWMLVLTYALSLVFTLVTHKDLTASAQSENEEPSWPLAGSLLLLGGVTVLVALVSEVFVGSVEAATRTLGLTPAFVGFILVALVGAAAEMTAAFAAARRNRLDLSLSIALGSAAQIALFVAPLMVLLSHVLAPSPMDLQFWPGAVVMLLIATLTVTLVTTGHANWYLGVLVLAVYLTFALTLYLMPPRPGTPAVSSAPGIRWELLRYPSVQERQSPLEVVG